jgi:hypothetical protein
MFQKTIALCGVGLSAFIYQFVPHAQAVKKQARIQVPSPLGINIEITVKPYKNTKVYLGTNYGQNRVLADSAMLNDASLGYFSGKEQAHPRNLLCCVP